LKPVALVVAAAENGVIGRCGKLPWRIADDMKHFKAVTIGKPCIMGRKTWDSLPRKPLPGRDNIVVTGARGFAAPGAVVVHSPEEALARAETAQGTEIAVIGGAKLYEAFLSRATCIYLTEVHRVFAGDAKFVFDRTHWFEVSRDDRLSDDGLPFSFVTLVRAAV